MDTFGVFTICENTERSLGSLACRKGRNREFEKAAKNLFGFEMPEPGQSVTRKPYSAIWIGPDQWLIEAPFDTHEDIAGSLKAGFGDCASVAEQTDAWAVFDTEGPTSVEVFARLCAIDLRRMETGNATRTAIEHLGAIVICREIGIRFSVLCPRSGAASLHHSLVTAAKSLA
jgi:sarcosine oxidase subunit gamma